MCESIIYVYLYLVLSLIYIYSNHLYAPKMPSLFKGITKHDNISLRRPIPILQNVNSPPELLYKAKANFPLILNFSPYFQNNTGKGNIARQRKPSKLVAQSTPSFSYICSLNSGKPAAMSALTHALAASALFAFRR